IPAGGAGSVPEDAGARRPRVPRRGEGRAATGRSLPGARVVGPPRPERLAAAPCERAVEGDAAEGAVHFNDAARPRPRDPGRAVLRARPGECPGDEGHGARFAPPGQDHPVLDAHHGAGGKAVRRAVYHRPRAEARRRSLERHQANARGSPRRGGVRRERRRGPAGVCGQRAREEGRRLRPVCRARARPGGGRPADPAATCRVRGGPGVEDSLAREVGVKRIDGFLVLSDALTASGHAEYRASNVSSLEDVGLLRETLGRLAERARLERAGVDPAMVARAQIRVSLDTKKITGGRTTEESAGQSFSLAYFMMLILYISLLLYGVQVMGSVIEEKTSRIIEVLVSSLRPFQLLLGKLLGVGAVSLVQFALWGASGRLLLSQRAALVSRMGGADPEVGQVFQVPHVSGATALVFIAFFLGGFFLYSAMFAAVAATCSTEQEARQSQVPVTVLIMIAFFGSFATLANPESRLAVTLSLVPFTSPIATPARWAAGNLTALDVIA